MINIEQFEDVFQDVDKSHYPSHLQTHIHAAQKSLGDKLFFHQLLDTLNINGSFTIHSLSRLQHRLTLP
jgi:hypothetical protein